MGYLAECRDYTSFFPLDYFFISLHDDGAGFSPGCLHAILPKAPVARDVRLCLSGHHTLRQGIRASNNSFYSPPLLFADDNMLGWLDILASRSHNLKFTWELPHFTSATHHHLHLHFASKIPLACN